MITENLNSNNWTRIITEEYGVTDQNKLAWVSQYAQNHAIYEDGGQAPTFANYGNGQLYANPLNTMGMGTAAAPGNENPLGLSAQRGSGDVPMSTLPMALNVALYTVGLELVPVVPAKGPWQMLSYMDFPYGGGKLGRFNETGFDGIGEGDANKPKYIKLDAADAVLDAIRALNIAENAELEFTTTGGTLKGNYKGFTRMDGKLAIEIVECKDADDKNTSIISVLRGKDATVYAKTADKEVDSSKTYYTFADDEYTSVTTAKADELKNYFEKVTAEFKPDFVQTQADLMDGFANFANGSKNPMTRAENETGTGNTIGLRLFSQWIQMGSYEVTGSVTRQQLQDLPLYGVDAVAKVMEAMQNELTQHINQRILDKVHALGRKNHDNQLRYQGVSLDLNFDELSTEEKHSFDNLSTRQRRIVSRILAAANLIQTTGRRGRADWVVTNTQIASALQDNASFAVKPVSNTMVQGNTSNLYNYGTLAGLQIYVDPYQNWNDNRVLVGRKGDANSPGVIFMPYILADTVSITAEGTMAPKMLVNSRFAIVEAGFYPELMYYEFNVASSAASPII